MESGSLASKCTASHEFHPILSIRILASIQVGRWYGQCKACSPNAYIVILLHRLAKHYPFLTKGIGEAASARAFLPERSCIADLKVQAALDCPLKEGWLQSEGQALAEVKGYDVNIQRCASLQSGVS